MSQNFKQLIINTLIFISLTILAIYWLDNLWWSDIMEVNSAKGGLIFICVGLIWIGVLHLSIAIARILVIKDNNIKYINIVYIFNNIDVPTPPFLKKLKVITLTLAVLFIFSIVLSLYSWANSIEKEHFKKFAVIETVYPITIDTGDRGIIYYLFNYNQNYQTHLPVVDSNKGLKDSFKVIYSSQRPEIIDYYEIEDSFH